MKNIKKSVLEFLEKSRGDFVSGEELASSLGVSRNSIWKAVRNLKNDGYLISAVTNKGYCLEPENDIISADNINNYLKLADTGFNFDIEVMESVDSTNNAAKKAAENGAHEGKIIIAHEQIHGKGRLGRAFYSPAGTGIYMSIVLRPKIEAAQTLPLTTAAAVAVCRAIEEVCGVQCSIKWLNDVYCGDKKVCGILTEASFDTENGALSYAVVGIGVNVKIPESVRGDFAENAGDRAGSVCSNENLTFDIRNRLTACIIKNYWELYSDLKPQSIISEYRKRSLLTGRRVKIIYSDGRGFDEVLVLDIADDFRLNVKFDDNRTESFSSGEISVSF